MNILALRIWSNKKVNGTSPLLSALRPKRMNLWHYVEISTLKTRIPLSKRAPNRSLFQIDLTFEKSELLTDYVLRVRNRMRSFESQLSGIYTYIKKGKFEVTRPEN